MMRTPNRILGAATLVTLVGRASTLLPHDDPALTIHGFIDGTITGATFWLM